MQDWLKLPPSWLAHRRYRFFYLVSYPRSGNTWTVNSLRDYLGAQRAEIPPSPYKGPLIKFSFRHRAQIAGEFDPGKPLGIKSHLSATEFAKRQFPKRKILYVLRDCRDVMTSYYFYKYGFLGENPSRADDFVQSHFNEFVRENLPDWVAHVTGWRTASTPIMVLKYEDLSTDYKGTLNSLRKFLDLPATSSLEEVERANVGVISKIDSHERVFQGNNRDFYRKGIVGDWRNYFDRQTKSIVGRIAGPLMRSLGYKN